MGEQRIARPGHLLFGLAFVAIGAAWLIVGGDSVVDAAWLVALSALAVGVAALGTAVAWLVR